MKKVIPFLLAGMLMVSGCTVFPDDYHDPYASHIEFGHSYGWSTYQRRPSYLYGCRGYYAVDGSCIYYQTVYVPVQAPVVSPEEDEVVPETQPRVMAVGDPWRYNDSRVVPRRERHEPGVQYRSTPRVSMPRSTQRMSSAGSTLRSAPRSMSRSTSGSRPSSTPRSTPRVKPRAKPRVNKETDR